MKSKLLKSIFISLILVMGVNNAWGKNFDSPHIYFNNYSLQWNPAMLLVGHSNYSIGYNQTENPIPNTKLVYFHPNASWDDQTHFTIGNSSNWGGNNEKWDSRVVHLTNRIGTQKDYDFNDRNTYYVTGSANPQSINVEYKSNDQNEGYKSIPKLNAKQAVKVRESKSDAYATLTGTYPAKLNLKGTYLSSYEESTRTTISGTKSSDNNKYETVVTGLVTHTYENLSSDYEFDGWGTGSSPSTTAANYEYNITAETTVYAFFTKKVISYTITYNLNNGTNPNNAPTSYNVTTATFDLPIPTKTGYTFVGWYDNQNLTGNAITQIAKGSTGNKTFYAKWLANKYTVKFHKNGGEGEMADQGFTYDAEQKLTENAFKRENALFVGWATSENGTVTYTDGQSVSNLTTTKDGVINLYAVWATIEITSHPEYIRTLDRLTLNISYTNIPQNWRYVVKIEAGIYNNSGVGQYTSITNGTGSSTYTAATQIPVKTNTVVVGLYANGDNFAQEPRLSASVTVICQSTHEIGVFAYTEGVNIQTGGTVNKNSIRPSINVPEEVVATPKTGYMFDQWYIINDNANITIENPHSPTTNVTATGGGQIYANFKKLPLKTIYLKTVEDTKDGDKWFVVYGGQEYEMTPLGCTGEYYRGEVPEGTSFHFVSKDNNDTQVETKGSDLQYVEGKTLYNLVSLAASGNKNFFNPNTNWLSTNWNNDETYKGQTPRFAALFDGNTWLDMTDNNDDEIFECVKPSGATKVYFCRMKPNTTANSWNEKWQQTDEQTIPNGKNLFTLPANVSLSDWARGGTWSEFADTPVNGDGEWTIFEGATYRITFNHEGAKSGTTTPGVAYVDAQYNSSMPTIESLPKNTDWKFAGYYTAANDGTPITNAFGDWLDADGYISNGKWVKEECVTLYAHWVEKTPEITNVALSKNVFDVGSVETVTATPTVVRHSYQGNFTICWKLLDNSGTVMDLFPFTPGNNNSVSFSVDGLTSGTYTVRASIYASACDTGEELSRFDAKITIVSGYKVTVKYLCGDNVIKVSDIYPGHATTPTPITAPEIGGYKFVNWELGDGIFSESDLSKQTISYTAIYDGYLTAKYEKRKLIFLDISTLPNKEKWTEPHIYLYNSNGYWDDTKGAGATGGACVAKGGMTKVANNENIWYYDYERVNNFGGAVAFTATNKMSQQDFWDCEAIYRTDFSSGTPVFVPASDQTAETKNSTAKYYNKGYWVKYMDGTGYWLIIYDAEGKKELVRREFTSDTQRMTMTSIVDLEAEHTYQYEIYRNDGYYYKGGDITYTNSSAYRPLNEANKHSIKTTETGDYTFTLDYFTGDLQIKVQYPGEVGDYRILYTDDVRGEGKYKPSQIISQNNKEPLVSFFVRPNNNPVLKIQKATLVTEEEVKWDNKGLLYLTPNSNWKQDNAWFAAYFFKQGDDNFGNEWAKMTDNDGDGTYKCSIPTTKKYPNVIFVRMKTDNQGLTWDAKWNQTGDLTIPTNDNNLFTIPSGSWDGATTTWSKRNNIIDLSNALKEKLRELGLTNIKENEGTVFNIHLSNNSGTPTIEKVALYTGNYYIRVDAVDGKWYDYKTNPDNLMTYSAFSESDENSFGEKFSHYKAKWCTQGMNVKFVIANDYSLCISDTLVQDAGNPFGNIDEHGNINKDDKYNANIRFMWNRHTNKVSRAYVAAASDEARKFLVLKANKTIQNESGQAINNNEVVFKDTQNWLYERTIKVQPGTLVKLYACYPDLDEAKAQHFRGKYSNDFTKDVTAVQILGGTSTEWYTMRIIYDFKTNRLMGAWVPDQNINGTLEIDADIMVIRQHQEDATYITFANNESELTKVKTVYGVMRFNRWTLNNRSTTTHDVLPVQNQKSIYERALYFISFPFDVHLSDVFGFGTYGTHWVISEYNGLRRAKNGYFVDNCMNEDCTNWDYIWDPDDFTMRANQGYLLSLDLDLMKSDNTSFWEHDIQQVELFFPSFAPVETIKQTSYTMGALGDDYICKHKGHEVLDTYWRCIGVPSFADYNSALTTDGTNKITWKPKDTQMPYLYEWNVSDNSLMVRAASTYRFRPTFAYLVQNGNQIHWSAVNATPNPSNIVARRQAADEVKNYEWKLTLSRNEQVEDQTFVRLSDNEQITTEFDFNQDLSKEFNYGRSDIYTLIGNTKAAANSLPFSEQTTLIPLGLSIEYNGDYTIAMPDGTANIGVTLVDNQTGTRTNLSAGMEYTLTLNKGDYNNRFFIEISPIQQTPTDIEYVTGDSNSQDSVRKVLIDNILYIVRDGQIFDARGARVK